MDELTRARRSYLDRLKELAGEGVQQAARETVGAVVAEEWSARYGADELPSPSWVVDELIEITTGFTRAATDVSVDEAAAIVARVAAEAEGTEREGLLLRVGWLLRDLRTLTAWSGIEVLHAAGCRDAVTYEMAAAARDEKLRALIEILEVMVNVATSIYEAVGEQPNITRLALLHGDTLFFVRRLEEGPALESALSAPRVRFERDRLQGIT